MRFGKALFFSVVLVDLHLFCQPFQAFNPFRLKTSLAHFMSSLMSSFRRSKRRLTFEICLNVRRKFATELQQLSKFQFSKIFLRWRVCLNFFHKHQISSFMIDVCSKILSLLSNSPLEPKDQTSNFTCKRIAKAFVLFIRLSNFIFKEHQTIQHLPEHLMLQFPPFLSFPHHSLLFIYISQFGSNMKAYAWNHK